mgnify:FL=1
MKSKAKIFTWIGKVCLLSALLLHLYNIYDNMNQDQNQKQIFEQYIQETNHQQDTSFIQIPDYQLNPEMEMPEVSIPGLEEAGCIGIIEIPSINIKLPVLSTWSYSLLKKAPCRYTGSIYLDNMVIAAHNSEAHFKKISNLQEGDIVTFTDAVGNVFTYSVAGIELLQPNEVDNMTNGQWPLTLFTCTYGGASRVTVRCEKNTE